MSPPSGPSLDAPLLTVRRYCESRTPAEHQDQFQVECTIRGKSITVYDCQAPWDPDMGPEWTRTPVAQLRYDPDDHQWRLYCADSNSRWHFYDIAEPTPRIEELLTEIDKDPTGIFWG